MKTEALCSVWKKNFFDNFILNQNHAWHHVVYFQKLKFIQIFQIWLGHYQAGPSL
jgi:hypothetical protein